MTQAAIKAGFAPGPPARSRRPPCSPFLLVSLSAGLFALSFPNPLVPDGFAPAAFVAAVPALVAVNRAGFRAAFCLGALYGVLSTLLFNYWLAAFHPGALPLVCAVLLVYYALFFGALRAAGSFYPAYAYLPQFALSLAFEYVRTLGFLGYPYGISGYSQWRVLPLIQIAEIAGVWGVSALVIFPNVYLARLLGTNSSITGDRGGRAARLVPALSYAAVLAASLVFGFKTMDRFDGLPRVRVALVQQNDDPWKNTVAEYRATLAILKDLSDRALAESPALVVWPETAFVPMIDWHTRYRADAAYSALTRELLDYLARQDTPFVVGNDDGRREIRDGRLTRVDYNAAVLFKRGEWSGVYRKRRLVPFAEHFPYQKQLPFVYALLRKTGMTAAFWEPGAAAPLFEAGGVRFATPICFEDGFGAISRDFTRSGAQLIVNMTNDSWGRSLSCQNQHLAMSVFRAVENRRSVARAATSGQTCGIDPAGRVLALAPPFVPAFLTVDLPLSRAQTPYTRRGDILPCAALLACAILLLLGTVRRIMARHDTQ